MTRNPCLPPSVCADRSIIRLLTGVLSVKDGCLVTIDEERTAREAQAVCDSYLSR